MGATNSAIFYFSDWLGEARLRMCSLGARGLWMDMLALAADAQEPGFVMIGPKPVDASSLARFCGASVEEVAAFLAELEEHEVFSRDARGWPYCRRMVRTARTRQRNSSGGRAAATANTRDGKGKFKQAGERAPATTTTTPSPSTSTTRSRGVSDETPPVGGGQHQLELVAQDVELAPKDRRSRALSAYNAVAPLGAWVAAKDLTAKRAKALDATLARLGIDGWCSMLEAAAKLRFFDCRRPREGKHANWRPSLDFFLSESKQAKIREGAYDRYGTDPQPLHKLTGGARLAAFALVGGVDSEGGHRH